MFPVQHYFLNAFLFFGGLMLVLAEQDHDIIDPPELIEAREQWLASMEKEGKKVRATYRDDLTKLERRFTRSNRQHQLDALQNEIKAEKNISDTPRSADILSRPHPIPELKFARSIYQRKMDELTRRKMGRYERKLLALKKKYEENEQPKALQAVDRELKQIFPEDAFATHERQKTNRSERAFRVRLTGTRWNVTNPSGEEGQFKFLRNGIIAMPKHPAHWKVNGPRHVLISHKNNHWSYQLIFSEDLKFMEGFRTKSNAVFWTGSRK